MRYLLAILVFLPAVVLAQTGPVSKTRSVRIAIEDDLDNTVRLGNPMPVHQGLASNQSVREKFGYNPSVATTSEIITSLSTTAFAGFLTSPTSVRIKSGGDADDSSAGTGARAILISGLDASFRPVSESLITNGTSVSLSTTQTFIRVLRAYVTDCGTYHDSNQGDIVIENSAGGTDLLQISSVVGQTESAVDTIPEGVTADLTTIRWNVEGTKEIELMVCWMPNVDDVSAPFSAPRVIIRLPGLTGAGQKVFHSAISIPEKSDVWAVATGPNGGAAIAVSFEMVFTERK